MQTLAHEFLDIERECGFEVDQSCYDTLDSLLERAREIDTSQEPKKILSDIASVFREFGLKPLFRMDRILSQGLQTKKVDCKQYPALYHSVAERLDLPLSIVLVPGHIVIRWSDGKHNINWETLDAKEVSDEYLISEYNISKKSITNGVYLRNLTREQAKAIAFASCGNSKAEKGDLDGAISDYNKAIGFFPKYLTVNLNIGISKTRKIDLDGAISAFDKAIELDPDCAKAYLNLGIAKELKGDLDQAREAYEKARCLDPFYSAKGIVLIPLNKNETKSRIAGKE